MNHRASGVYGRCFDSKATQIPRITLQDHPVEALTDMALIYPEASMRCMCFMIVIVETLALMTIAMTK